MALFSIPEFIMPQSEAEARSIQERLRENLKLSDDFAKIKTIAGIDVCYDVKRSLAHSSIVIMKIEDLKPVKSLQAFTPSNFPYIPGLLAFREIPAILAVLAQIKTAPDLLMIDGQGIAHPRRMGIAAHLGVILDMPSIGIGKSRLTGKFENPGNKKGDVAPLFDRGEQIGTVLRSRDNVNPLFISPGHRVSVETALEIVIRCLTKYRLPEPTRLADKLSKVTKEK